MHWSNNFKVFLVQMFGPETNHNQNVLPENEEKPDRNYKAWMPSYPNEEPPF